MHTWLGIVCLTWALFVVTHAGDPYKEKVRNIIRELDVYVHSNAEHAAEWLRNYNMQLKDRRHSEALAEYVYLTDITDANLKKYTKVQVSNLEWDKEQISVAKKFLEHIPESDFIERSHYRMLKLITATSVVSNEISVNQEMSDLRAELEKIYGTTKVDGKTLDELEVDIKTGTYEEKVSIWKKWRDAVGPKMRPIYTKFIKYQNIAAKESGYTNLKEAWILSDYGYETKDLEAMAEKLLSEIQPLYKQLHAYVRRKLYERYPEQNIDLHGPIPAHLLGNMWAQQWENTDANLLPYPKAMAIDVTPVLQQQKYTPKMMFKLAEDFFESVGLNKMTDTFWEKSMITRPKDREVQCHASATDLYKSGDFRIKMCTNVNQDDLFTIHHEMGHIQYFMEYEKQPAIFRNGANAAFHEAIGDTIALSVSTPKHFHTIGLLQKDSGNKQKLETDLNFLMSQALQKIAFLPFGYMIDKYRWDIFTGDIDYTNYNSKWWQMREKYQGVTSPVPRSEADFDPGAKYHVPAHVPYSRYFISFISQFQFYESMCTESGHTGALYECDFYKSKPAGSLLKSMLELGQSVPWQDAMETMTGQRTVSTTAIMEYFKPLQIWLQNENTKNKEYIGWI